MIKGSCYCGTVRYEVSGPFNSMVNCHCSMCRKHHGSPFATYVSAPIANFQWVGGEDALIRYEASERGTRDSCKVCGSPVPTMMPGHGLALLPAGPLEGDLGIVPQAHIFVGSKAPWYTITDTLPQHEEYPPKYAMPGLQRASVQARPGITEGSCLCAEVAYEVQGAPMFMQSCHCQRCRRSKGAAHATNMFYKVSQFRWTRGEELVGHYKLPEARFSTSSFCRQCGAVMPRVSKERDMVVIAAGSLDTDPPMRSQRHIFTSYKASWFEITDSAPQFPEAPPPG
jgi:hypothetical protein